MLALSGYGQWHAIWPAKCGAAACGMRATTRSTAPHWCASVGSRRRPRNVEKVNEVRGDVARTTGGVVQGVRGSSGASANGIQELENAGQSSYPSICGEGW